jgi:hypothetical protein
MRALPACSIIALLTAALVACSAGGGRGYFAIPDGGEMGAGSTDLASGTHADMPMGPCDGCSGLCCSGRCTDVRNDRLDCGSCGHACGVNEVCSGGVCSCMGGACGAGQTCCNSGCQDLRTDSSNCGACGNDCTGAAETCLGGQCGCGMGGVHCAQPQQCCGNACADTTSDIANCGACGNACGFGQSCAGGACSQGMQCGGMTCAPGEMCLMNLCLKMCKIDADCPIGKTCFFAMFCL